MTDERGEAISVGGAGGEDIVAARVRVSGLVQGVGFRPFVWREATRRGLAGWVGNDGAGVVLVVEGVSTQVDSLLTALLDPPSMARVDGIRREVCGVNGFAGFEVRASEVSGSRVALVSPDTATCTECLAELRDPDDRRFGFPFINCTNCGPRYTIVESVPYDRARTTMAAFPMCTRCAAEYADPADRRFHAEPVCCPACGPALQLVQADGSTLSADPLPAAVERLRAGEVLAVKGLGGYHLVADAANEEAVSRLRSRKNRKDRPFALMVGDLAMARSLCLVGSLEVELLKSPARPIVLLTRRKPDDVATAVAPGSPSLGVMLAYTPLHHLLLDAYQAPLVVTSANTSDEPIAFDDSDARARLATIADAFLVHDRVIQTRVDDSVVKVMRGRAVPIRRSRGYVPGAINLRRFSAGSVLGCGAGLKNTFCLTRGAQAFVSPHVGDLDDYSTYSSFVSGIRHFQRLLDVDPSVVAHDMHPDYPSTGYAVALTGVELLSVQHHHAHIASCLADNDEDSRVIGVAFDGLGLGTDGTAWGGEFLIADLEDFTRAAHLAPVPMPGGDRATREPWRMAAAHLNAAYDGDVPTGLAIVGRHQDRWAAVLSIARSGVNAPMTSSAGRLFDAVAALLGLRDLVTYEGQAAIELEWVADRTETGSYPTATRAGIVDVGQVVRSVCTDLARGVAVSVIAARFHNSLADVVHDVCQQLREEHTLDTVALSGGVFQNALLTERCLTRLEDAGFTVLTHRQVPPNDGGISLGQVAVASARLHARS